MKFHITDEGEARPCSAKTKCRFGADAPHFSSAEDARLYFEASQHAFEYPPNDEQLRKALPFIREQLRHDFSSQYAQDAVALIEDLSARYPMIVARTRAVFFTEDEVIKVPTSDEGLGDSLNEARAWESYKAEEKYALPMARTVVEESASGVTLIRCERVTPLRKISYKELPDWVGWVDCGQVGYTREGVLVAYDL